MIVTAGATNRSVFFYVVGDASHASPGDPLTGLLFSDIETGGSASYSRAGAARVDLTLITLASASAAHSDGGFILVDDTNMPGVYRCDYPDAAFATGVDQVVLQLVVASAKNAVAAPILADIFDINVRDSVRAGMTALPNAAADAAGGLIISDAGGLSADVMAASVAAIETDTGTTLDTKLNNAMGPTFNTSTDSLEAIRNEGSANWTGSPITSATGTATAGSANTITLQNTASALADTYNGQLIYISAGTGAGQSRAISDYAVTTFVATVITNWSVNPSSDSVYSIYPNEITEITAAPTAAVVAAATWDLATTGHTSAGTFGEQCKNDIDAILTDSNELQSDWTNTGRLDTIIDSILNDTDLIDDATSGLAKIATDVAAVLVDTDVIDDGTSGLVKIASDVAAVLVDTGTTLDAALAVVDGNVDLILADTGTDGVVLAADQGVDVTKISGNAAAADNLEAASRAVISGSSVTGTLTVTACSSDLTAYAADELIGRVISWYSGTAAGQSSDITDYVVVNGVITYTAVNTAPINGDLFVIT